MYSHHIRTMPWMGLHTRFRRITRPPEAEKIKQVLDWGACLVGTEIFFVFLGVAFVNKEIHRASPFAFYGDNLSGHVAGTLIGDTLQQ